MTCDNSSVNSRIDSGSPLVQIGVALALGADYLVTHPGCAKGSSAAAAFLVYSFLNGLTLSVIFWAYTGASITMAFVTAAGMFGAMSIYGTVTKRNLTSWGSFFFMGLIGIVLASIVNIFVHSNALTFTVSILGVFIFLGLTAWDTQKLKAMVEERYGDGNDQQPH